VSLYLITYNLLLTTELLNNYELLRVAYKCFREQFPIILLQRSTLHIVQNKEALINWLVL